MSELDRTVRLLSKGLVKDCTDLLAYRTSFKLSKTGSELLTAAIILLNDQAVRMNERLFELGRILDGMIERSSAFGIEDDRVREDASIDEFLA